MILQNLENIYAITTTRDVQGLDGGTRSESQALFREALYEALASALRLVKKQCDASYDAIGESGGDQEKKPDP